MIPYPDLNSYPAIAFERFKWLLDRGVPIATLIELTPIRLAIGKRADDGRFDESPDGSPWLVFPEEEDVVYWQPRTGALATWNGRAFALGDDAIGNPGTYSFDCHLNLFADPLDWLRAKRDGIVVLDWSRAYSRLQDCPRIAVTESLVFQYRRHMKPPTGAEIYVLKDRKAAA